MDAISILSARTMSAFPLSIGTSLAFESVFDGVQAPYDPTRQIPEKINIMNYNVFLINVSTLVRNIIGAIPTQEAESLTPRALLMALEDEIRYIIDIVKIHDTLGNVNIYFYSRNYTIIKQTFSRSRIVRFYEAHTAKQINLQNQIEGTVKLLRKNPEFEFVHYDLGVNLYPKSTLSALLFTHVPYDLLVNESFRILNLLESHTGLLKSRKDFWTKYYEAKKLDLSNIPFQRKLLAIFGDHILFKPTPIIIRQDIIALAKKCQWTSVSSLNKINTDFNTRLADIGIRHEYNSM